MAPNAPVIGTGAGLLQNGVYNVAMVDPNGAAVYDENLTLVTDGDGNLNATVLAYLGNDTQSQAGAMVVSKTARLQMGTILSTASIATITYAEITRT